MRLSDQGLIEDKVAGITSLALISRRHLQNADSRTRVDQIITFISFVCNVQ